MLFTSMKTDSPSIVTLCVQFPFGANVSKRINKIRAFQSKALEPYVETEYVTQTSNCLRSILVNTNVFNRIKN